MTCSEFKDLLDLYVDGELPEETRSRIERHLMRCADCGFQVASLEQARALLRESYPVTEAEPAFRERMAARLHDEFRDVLRQEQPDIPNQRAFPF